MNRPADWNARGKALDADRSFIVQAPAGSGKTELLTQRMLVLLARVDNPEEVVAITFTRKAAAEMAHRLIGHLRKADAGGDESELEAHERHSRQLARAVLENDRKLGWGLLEQPSRLRIRTIDSLCGELARQLPILSGLGGGLQVSEEAHTFYRRAAVNTLSAIEKDGDGLQADVARVLRRYDNQYDRLAEMLTGMLGNRDQWLEFLVRTRSGNGFDREALEEALSLLVEAELQKAWDLFPSWLSEELPGFLGFMLEHAPADEAELRQLVDACCSGGVLQMPVTPGSLPLWTTLLSRMLTQSGSWLSGLAARHGFPSQAGASATDKILFKERKAEYKALIGRLHSDESLREQLALVRKLPGPHFSDEAWVSLESLNRILLQAAAEWKVVMAETGIADFTEVSERAIRALGDPDHPTDLALRLDYRIRHLLVDEFQDTSYGQIRLLKGLTAGWSEGDGHSLFLVGDPMQSIYRFRKAEVSLFIEAFSGHLFRHLRLEPLHLCVNFRSTSPVVNWVNTHFPAVMPPDNDAVSGAVRYSPSETPPGAGTHGTVELHLSARRDDVREAERIVNIIRDSDPEQTVAILVRVRKHAAETLALLDRLKQDDARYRYRAVKFTPLGETTLVRDLVSLTLAFTQPADRLSWLALLRAPFVGLSLSDLDALAGGRDAPLIPDALAACLAGDADGLSKDGRQRLQRTGPALLEAANRYGHEPVRGLVESAWLRLGGPACIENENELADASAFFDLLSTLEQEGAPIDRDSLAQQLGELFAEPDAHAGEHIQVMTIYQAKGLQFDSVILPGLNKGAGGNDPRMLHWFELPAEGRVVMCPMRDQREKEKQKKSGDLIQYISNIESKRQSLENGRLLYVAATRARHSLHLLAAVEPNSQGVVQARRGTLLGELWQAVSEEQVPRILADMDDLGELTPEAALPKLPQLHRRLSGDWIAPAAPGAVARSPAEPAEPPDYIEFQWAGEDARLTGDLVHRLLQSIAEEGESAWRARGGMAGHEAWCRRQLLAEGVNHARADAILERTARGVENSLASDTGRWVLAGHEESECELAITAVLDGKPTNLVLDRTFVEDGTRWIIDYKTGSHTGGDLEGFLENEADRYRSQLERYRQAMALSESRPIRIALYFPLMDRFKEL